MEIANVMTMLNNRFSRIAAYPNQRVVKIVNESAKAPYVQINIGVLNSAAKALIPIYPSAFELWICLSKNQSGYEMAFIHSLKRLPKKLLFHLLHLQEK